MLLFSHGLKNAWIRTVLLFSVVPIRIDMKGKYLIIFFLVSVVATSAMAQYTPNQMVFCGVRLHFTAKARQKIDEYVSLAFESPRYYNQMVDRMRLYAPFIEKELLRRNVPTDLKFITIQESGLLADAVSSSNAVGFWQFKAASAMEEGLQITEAVDERMHIGRSSQAAASYIAKANRHFDNWLYAILAFKEGLTGAIPSTDPKFYGKDEMVITDTQHWYMLKAIAHKIAYSPALNIKVEPVLWLSDHRSEGKFSIKKVSQQHQISTSEFLEYNKWIRDKKLLAKDGRYIYYIPESGQLTKVEISKQSIEMTNQQVSSDKPERPVDVAQQNPEAPLTPISTPTSTPTTSKAQVFTYPEAKSLTDLDPSRYVVFPLRYDLHFGIDYILANGKTKMMDIAIQYGIRLNDLLEWNSLEPGEEAPAGEIIFMSKPSKASFHIVQANETIYEIAFRYGLTIPEIQQRNRMELTDNQIYKGQKLYIRKRKPKNEKLIVLEGPYSAAENRGQSAPAPTKSISEANKPVETKEEEVVKAPIKESISTSETNSLESPQSEGPRWVQHTVKQGENLYQIAKLYASKEEVIKRINKMESNDIFEGQVLRILTSKP